MAGPAFLPRTSGRGAPGEEDVRKPPAQAEMLSAYDFRLMRRSTAATSGNALPDRDVLTLPQNRVRAATNEEITTMRPIGLAIAALILSALAAGQDVDFSFACKTTAKTTTKTV
ncbi:hypothetical protein AB4Z34_33325 [Ensifer sp. 2YAB10]|uniref:hypothetical protein n=1 Tax=unclassified Ensifer TaxID=2633371 RepID=UPI003F923BEE